MLWSLVLLFKIIPNYNVENPWIAEKLIAELVAPELERLWVVGKEGEWKQVLPETWGEWKQIEPETWGGWKQVLPETWGEWKQVLPETWGEWKQVHPYQVSISDHKSQPTILWSKGFDSTNAPPQPT